MLDRSRKGSEGAGDPTVIGIIAISEQVHARALADTLAQALAAIGCKAAVLGAESEGRSTAWFSEQESSHDLVLLAAEEAEAGWREVCVAPVRPHVPGRLTRCERARRTPTRSLSASHRCAGTRWSTCWWVRPRASGCPTAAWHGGPATAASRGSTYRRAILATPARLGRVLAGRASAWCCRCGAARALADLGAVPGAARGRRPVRFVGAPSIGARWAPPASRSDGTTPSCRNGARGLLQHQKIDDIAFPLLAMDPTGTSARPASPAFRRRGDRRPRPCPSLCVSADP